MIDSPKDIRTIRPFRKLKSKCLSSKNYLNEEQQQQQSSDQKKNVQKRLKDQLSPFKLKQMESRPSNIKEMISPRELSIFGENLQTQLFTIFQTEFKNLLKELHRQTQIENRQQQDSKDSFIYKSELTNRFAESLVNQNLHKIQMNTSQSSNKAPQFQFDKQQQRHQIFEKRKLRNQILMPNIPLVKSLKYEGNFKREPNHKSMGLQERKFTLNQLSAIQQGNKSFNKHLKSEQSFNLSKSYSAKQKLIDLHRFTQKHSIQRSNHYQLSPKPKQFIRSKICLGLSQNPLNISQSPLKISQRPLKDDSRVVKTWMISQIKNQNLKQSSNYFNDDMKVRLYNKLLFVKN